MNLEPKWRLRQASAGGAWIGGLALVLLIFAVPSTGSHVPVEELPDPPAGKVTLHLDAKLLDVPGMVGFFEPVEETERIGTTKILEPDEPIPRGARIEEGILFLTPGKFRKYVIVYENPSDREVTFITPSYFEWEPPTEEAYLRLRNACRCGSFLFTVPAGGAWLQTAAIAVTPTTEPGDKFVWRWVFVNAAAEK